MITNAPKINVVWLKRDLRLEDNEAICKALASGERTLLLYAFETMLIEDNHYSERHWNFIKESIRDLNQRLDSPVDMRRFRPNVVLAGCEAFAEDKLSEFSIGDLQMKAVKICSRCPMPMVDPDLGERTSQEPIATLSTYRKWDGKIFFGMNVIQQQQGVISVGDSLES